MTAQNSQATYACLNLYESFCPQEIASRSICVRGDIDGVLRALRVGQMQASAPTHGKATSVAKS